MKQCRKLVVRGDVRFSEKNFLEGEVEIVNGTAVTSQLPPGTYRDTQVKLGGVNQL